MNRTWRTSFGASALAGRDHAVRCGGGDPLLTTPGTATARAGESRVVIASNVACAAG
ncbi:MAG: hypothetical protein WD960_09775 [Gemmatimonadota bacterium]